MSEISKEKQRRKSVGDSAANDESGDPTDTIIAKGSSRLSTNPLVLLKDVNSTASHSFYGIHAIVNSIQQVTLNGET